MGIRGIGRAGGRSRNRKDEEEIEKVTAIAEDLAEQLEEKDNVIAQLTERIEELEGKGGCNGLRKGEDSITDSLER